MNKFVRYVTLSSSSKICCMAKGAKTLLQWIHILFDHMKTFPRAVFLSLRMYNPWIEMSGCVLLCGMETVLRLQYVYTYRL
jgi:hypothetical protein